MPDFTGILCIDKPSGFTSFDVVAKMRGIARERRIGHAGTLDPMATGVLPLFFGRATKACDILPLQDKRYTATFRLGITTDTQDITGAVLSQSPVNADRKAVEAAAAQFVGAIQQVPPMYSAVKVNGQRLYDLARRGVEVERQAREITIYSIEFLDCDEENTYSIDVFCSKGTYIRTLVADIGEALGCGAALTALRRTMAAGFTLDQCITLEQAQQLAGERRLPAAGVPVEYAFEPLPKAQLTEMQTKMALNGVSLDPSRVSGVGVAERYSVYSDKGIFIGIAAVAGGNFKMTKLFTLEV
ncbi:tRNA pseudouridine(55) synthase TruB [Marasmitruncus massiliensis]|uniref:tRNA pseudouridine(55) synthase TruB n=1 Tax=Marasmitruncus massiliensis TaxID=1944642 RepID=UPI000C7DDE6C|nr:tRNA pseudouridine(55) synthase TruB [Marasmitruncus massiliensis]